MRLPRLSAVCISLLFSGLTATSGWAATPSTETVDSDPMQRLQTLVDSRVERLESGWAISLEQALTIALSSSPTVALEEASREVAIRQVESTRSAYRPTISASAGVEVTTGSGYVAGSNQLGGSQTRTSATSLNASLSAEQLIYDFGRTAAQRRAAQARVAVRDAYLEQNFQDIRSEVIKSYLQAGAAREQMLVALETLSAEQQRAEQIRAYVEVGLRPTIDLATARANVASASARFIDAETAYDLATFDLLAMMGATDDTELHVQWTELETDALETLNLNELRDLAQGQRGELRALAESIVAAEEGIRATANDGLPTIRANAGISESYLVGQRGRWNAYIGARIGWTIYQGGRVRFQRAEQEAELTRLSAEEHQIVTAIVQQIRRAQRSIQGAQVALETRSILVENAQEQLSLAQGRYETGMGNIVELSDAQLALTEARFAEIEASLNLSLSRADLISAIAGWEDSL